MLPHIHITHKFSATQQLGACVRMVEKVSEAEPVDQRLTSVYRLPLLRSPRITLTSGAGSLLHRRSLWTSRAPVNHQYPRRTEHTVVKASKPSDEGDSSAELERPLLRCCVLHIDIQHGCTSEENEWQKAI